jgi:hypothetical protein
MREAVNPLPPSGRGGTALWFGALTGWVSVVVGPNILGRQAP